MTRMRIFSSPSEVAVKHLLQSVELPTSDITAEHLSHFFACGSNADLTGVVGLEIFDDVALLRSLAIAAAQRHAGLGAMLTSHAERHALEQGAQSLYLLTDTAEQFFARIGYVHAPRAQAPAAIRNTREFSDICPANSAFMVKHLRV